MEDDTVKCGMDCGGEVNFRFAQYDLPAEKWGHYGVCICNKCGKAYFHVSHEGVSLTDDAGSITEIFFIDGKPVILSQIEVEERLKKIKEE